LILTLQRAFLFGVFLLRRLFVVLVVVIGCEGRRRRRK